MPICPLRVLFLTHTHTLSLLVRLQCIPRLRATSPSATSATKGATAGDDPGGADGPLTPHHLDEMDLLLTKLLLSDARASKGNPELRTWLSMTSTGGGGGGEDDAGAAAAK